MNNVTSIFIASGLAMALAACSSVDRLMDSGEYDKLIARYQKKGARKIDGTAKVDELAAAFNRAQRRDLSAIESHAVRGSVSDWESALRLTADMAYRQEFLAPVLPLRNNRGRWVTFSWYDVDSIEQHATIALAGELYRKAGYEMEVARSGDKRAARSAYDRYTRLSRLPVEYTDISLLRNEAHDLGMLTIATSISIGQNFWLPDYFLNIIEKELEFRSDAWTRYVRYSDDVEADAHAELVLTDLQVRPGRTREERERRQRRISDGWDYVLDSRGNVLKDSLGNDVRTERIRTVYATLIESYQEKEVQLDGIMYLREMDTNRTLDTRDLRGTDHFSHGAQWYQGDERALRSGERRYIGLKPFPSDEQMIREAIDQIKDRFARELHREIKREIFMS